MQYCIETGELGLQINPVKPLNNLHEIIGYSDFDYAKDIKLDKMLVDIQYF
jgi:hypothetical protein